MPSLTADAIASHAAELAHEFDATEAANKLIEAAGRDRVLMEAARDQLAAHLHAHGDDWQATAALTVLNRALSLLPRYDPMDWRVRWSRHRKP